MKKIKKEKIDHVVLAPNTVAMVKGCLQRYQNLQNELSGILVVACEAKGLDPRAWDFSSDGTMMVPRSEISMQSVPQKTEEKGK